MKAPVELNPSRWLAWMTLWGLALGGVMITVAAIVDHRHDLAFASSSLTSVCCVAAITVGFGGRPAKRMLCGRCAMPTVERRGVAYCGSCDWYTNWPPVGEHAAVWARFERLRFSDDERLILRDVLTRWMNESSTTVSFTDENGAWVDVEWPWSTES